MSAMDADIETIPLQKMRCGNLGRKTMSGDCDDAFLILAARFALLLVLWALALPPLLYGVWAGGF